MILVVDDFRDAGEALCRLLARVGYPCQTAVDGREALALIRAYPHERPLLVVLDEMMPAISGIEVLREIRADPSIANTTVLFHSAGFDLARRDEAITLGAVAWLLKGGGASSDIQRLIDTIGEWYQRIGGVATPRSSRESTANKPDQSDASPGADSQAGGDA